LSCLKPLALVFQSLRTKDKNCYKYKEQKKNCESGAFKLVFYKRNRRNAEYRTVLDREFV
ncbi:MAG: hypothetical protein OXJ52_02790, partial [Oligoflexia bacterium]|nr:hypothetical protein [Oligoflexia bacterium]